MNLTSADLERYKTWTAEDFARELQANPLPVQQFFELVKEDRRKCALAYYEPMNPMAAPVHTSMAREIAIVGGNRSGKTETALVELAIQATGHIPVALQATYPREKLRPPIRARVVCNSLTDTLEPVIKPKLRWDQWSGSDDPGGAKGHFGWIPERCLWGNEWEKAYSEKYRTLKLRVDNYWRDASGLSIETTGISTIQFLSYDQDLTAFSGSSMHLIVHDELPPSDLYRENRMRTLDVKGRIITAFTPPDETGSNRADVAWFFDEIYERGLPGPGKAHDIDTFILWTEKNRILSPVDVEQITRTLSEEQRQARLYGQFLHLAGVVYPLFAAAPATWCFRCEKKVATGTLSSCTTCQSDNVESFCHVIDEFEIPKEWPVIFVIDPHPRKMDACGWFAITPADQVVMIGELEVGGDTGEVARQVFDWEKQHRIAPVKRLMDPNMATQTNDKLEHGWTFRMGYDRVGLRCDLANDSIPLGIQNVNELLRPTPYLRRPRFETFSTNRKFIYGMTHWAWDEWVRHQDREPKEIVRDRYKDFPDLLRYLANDLPGFKEYRRASTRSERGVPYARGY